jgi:hypothetical protein
LTIKPYSNNDNNNNTNFTAQFPIQYFWPDAKVLVRADDSLVCQRGKEGDGTHILYDLIIASFVNLTRITWHLKVADLYF